MEAGATAYIEYVGQSLEGALRASGFFPAIPLAIETGPLYSRGNGTNLPAQELGLPAAGVPFNDLIVSWNGGQVLTLSAGGFGLEETEWTHYSTVVTAANTWATVEFSDAGNSDGVGT